MDDFSFGTLRVPQPGTVEEAQFSGGRPFVRFYAASEIMKTRSEAEGKPVFRKVDMVEIQQPGQRDNCIREVLDWHKRAFKLEWDAYEAGQEQVATGTPLAVLFPANPEIVDGLRALKVHTVEQLADLSDSAVQDMGLGAVDFRAKAARFLAAAAKGAEIGRAEAAEKSMAEMKAEMAKMRAELDARPAASSPTETHPDKPVVEPMRRKVPAQA